MGVEMDEYIKRKDVLSKFLEYGIGWGTAKVKGVIESIPAADVVEIVRCKDCIYWQKPQIKLHDGTYRDYEPGEYENGSILGGVELNVGINVGSFCAKYDKWHGNKIPQFMGENDFCSKGEKRAECTK